MKRLSLIIFLFSVSLTLSAQGWYKHSMEAGVTGSWYSNNLSAALLATNRVENSKLPLSFQLNYLNAIDQNWQLGLGWSYFLPADWNHFYKNSIGNEMNEYFSLNRSTIGILGRRLFHGAHFVPYYEFRLGYNLVAAVDYKYKQTITNGLFTPTSNVEKKKGGLSMQLGAGTYINEIVRIGFNCGWDRYGADIFVNTTALGSYTTPPTHDSQIINYQFNDLSYNFSIAYLFGFGTKREISAGTREVKFNKGLRVKTGISYGNFNSNYENYTTPRSTGVTMSSTQINTFVAQAPTFNIATDYLIMLNPSLSVGAGVKYESPVAYRWENMVLETTGTTEARSLFWETFTLSKLEPYGILQYNFNAAMSPYFRILGGYAFNFTTKEEKYKDDTRTFTYKGNKDGFYGGIALGCSLTSHWGVELSHEGSWLYCSRKYNSPNKKGISDQEDLNKGWLTSTGINVFYKF